MQLSEVKKRNMKSQLKSRRSGERPNIRPRVKFWLEIGGERAFCPGVCQILQEIERTGSIKDAAAAIGRSYRFVWGKLKAVEVALGQPLVETRVGGSQEKRSVLTQDGRVLMDEFIHLRQVLFDLLDNQFTSRIARALPTKTSKKEI